MKKNQHIHQVRRKEPVEALEAVEAPYQVRIWRLACQ